MREDIPKNWSSYFSIQNDSSLTFFTISWYDEAKNILGGFYMAAKEASFDVVSEVNME